MTMLSKEVTIPELKNMIVMDRNENPDQFIERMRKQNKRIGYYLRTGAFHKVVKPCETEADIQEAKRLMLLGLPIAGARFCGY